MCIIEIFLNVLKVIRRIDSKWICKKKDYVELRSSHYKFILIGIVLEKINLKY